MAQKIWNDFELWFFQFRKYISILKIFSLNLEFDEHASYYLLFSSCLHSSRAKVIEWQQTHFLKVIWSHIIFRDICHAFSVAIATLRPALLSVHVHHQNPNSSTFLVNTFGGLPTLSIVHIWYNLVLFSMSAILGKIHPL